MPDLPVPDNIEEREPAEDPEPVISEKDKELLKEIRDDFRHFLDYWRENREEMETDMRFAAGDAFTPDERGKRKGRPCETPDELSQYVKQTNNNLRQNKRDATLVPASEEANGDDAEKRESVLRGLNHRGNFQAVFQTAYECCTWSGFGYFGISLKKGRDGHIEPVPRRFPNQFAILPDPYAKQADYSDQKKCFVIDNMRQSDFVEAWPDAQKRSFSLDDIKLAGDDWIKGENITVAEAWRVEKGKVTQYITNGLEILSRDKWIGSWIPIIPILGEEIYTTESGQTKRKYLSLIRRARTPQKMLAFIASQELEEFGMAPRAPFIGYKGQFSSPDWATINTSPKPYIEVPVLADPLSPAGTPLPLPTRPQFSPNAQSYEIAREAWRRSVQAAMGLTQLPTAAQRQNEKSGIALEKIQSQESTGSYHFVDNADRALVNYGRQMNELITKTMPGKDPRHVGVQNRDETHGLLYVTTKERGIPQGMDPAQALFVDSGEYDFIVKPGPSRESQREDASEFVDTLIQNLQGLPIPPQIGQKILSIAIKLKNIGPLGEEIAKLLDPNDGDPMQKAQQLMAQAAQQQQLMQELQAELQQLRLEKQGKVIEGQNKLAIAQIEQAAKVRLAQIEQVLQLAKIQAGITQAEINTKAQSEIERASQLHEVGMELHEAAHELGMQASDQAHERDMASLQHSQALEQGQQVAENASAQSAQDASQDQSLAAANQPQEGAQPQP